MKKVLVIGAESSGKTTFCEALAERLQVSNVVEYGRLFGELTDNVYTYEDMEHIALQQVFDEIFEVTLPPGMKIGKFIVCDTSPLVTSFYSQKWYGKISPVVQELMDRSYDVIFFMARDFEYVDDGSRNGVEFGAEQEEYYVKHLKQPYTTLYGPVEARVEQAVAVLREAGLCD